MDYRKQNKIAIRVETEPVCLICGKSIKEKELFVGYFEDKIINLHHAKCWKNLKKTPK